MRIRNLASSRLVGRSTIYLITNALNAAIPFALIPIFTHHLTPAEYGEIGVFQTLVGALGAIIGLNAIGAIGSRHFSSIADDTKNGSFTSTCLQILLASSLISIAAAAIFQVKLEQWLHLDWIWIYSAILIASSTYLAKIPLTYWMFEKKPLQFGALQTLQTATLASTSLLLVVCLNQGPEGRMRSYAVTALALTITSVVILNKKQNLRLLTWNTDLAINALKFGIPLIPHTIGMFLLNLADRFIINSKLGPSDAGIYFFAAQISAATTILFDAVNKSYIPFLFEKLKGANEEDRKILVRQTYKWFCAVIIGASLLAISAPTLTPLISSEEYYQAGPIIGWLVIGQAFNGMYQTVGNYIFYEQRTGLLSMITISVGALYIAFIFTFIDAINIDGTAMAFAASMLIRFLLTWFLAHRCHPMPWLTAIFVKETKNKSSK